MANNNKIPAPTSHDVPKFDPSKPEELIWFFKLIDDLYTAYGIIDDGSRKETVGKYTDSQTEREWQAMDAYDNGTWDELKKEITESYPEASRLQLGSLKALQDVCASPRGSSKQRARV
jgi:hypothetical protein